MPMKFLQTLFDKAFIFDSWRDFTSSITYHLTTTAIFAVTALGSLASSIQAAVSEFVWYDPEKIWYFTGISLVDWILGIWRGSKTIGIRTDKLLRAPIKWALGVIFLSVLWKLQSLEIAQNYFFILCGTVTLSAMSHAADLNLLDVLPKGKELKEFIRSNIDKHKKIDHND